MPYLTSASLPGTFSRMSVVSTQRRLPGAGSTVVINAGPTNLGRAPQRLAAVAPGALPRVVIEARVGAPVAARPWVQSRTRPQSDALSRARGRLRAVSQRAAGTTLPNGDATAASGHSGRAPRGSRVRAAPVDALGNAVRVEDTLRANAESLRARVASGRVSPSAFRAALDRITPRERDTWLNRVFEVDALAAAAVPTPARHPFPICPPPSRSCCASSTTCLIQDGDVFVDVGAGLGRAAALVHLVTGAAAIGVEVQPALVHAARALAARLNLSRLSFVEGDAASRVDALVTGSVFFLYCPFSGERLQQVLVEARAHRARASRSARLLCRSAAAALLVADARVTAVELISTI